MILNIDNYPNIFLNRMQLTSQDVSNMVGSYPLTFFKTKDQKVEDSNSMPPFIDAFYTYIFMHQRILNQKDFYEYYISFKNNHNLLQEYSVEGVKSRVYRIYPSLVRELHFILFTRENITEAEIRYHTNLDKNGIDMVIIYKEKLYAVRLLMLTYNATKYSDEKKNERHTEFENVKYIDFPLDTKNSGIHCGDFILYGNEELNKLIEILNAN